MQNRIERDERIGERLQRFNVLESYHIDNVLIRQRHGDKRLFGQIAIDLGYVQNKTLETYLGTHGLELYDKLPDKSPNIHEASKSGKKAR